MAAGSEIIVDGVAYVLSRTAAETTGYAQDYVGQLARSGAIEARRIGGMWYVSLASLHSYKTKAEEYVPTPPQTPQKTEPEALISFDGGDYISASKASEVTGYHPDYVGQLARAGQVLARQVGSRWYVHKEGLFAHKKEKDALLAAVQADSVGLKRPFEIGPISIGNASYNGNTPLFTYVTDERELLPTLSGGSKEGELETKIPIRISPVRYASTSLPAPENSRGSKQYRRESTKSRKWLFIAAAAATVVICVAVGFSTLKQGAEYAQRNTVKNSGAALAAGAAGAVSSLGDVLERLLARELTYFRKN